jgi:antirestriction protein ArdC
MTQAKFDIYQHVTDEIIASIEAGSPAWQQPWTGETGGAGFPMRSTGEAYRGINVLMLWLRASAQGYRSAYWFTYRQAQEAGGQVRKGEKSATVVKYGTIEKEDEHGEEKTIPYCRAYRVFNADQIEGLPAEFHGDPMETPRDLGSTADPALDRFFASLGIAIRSTEEPRAYYNIKEDFIHMPPVATFHDAGGYYGTLAHEVTHATGHKDRLDRFARLKDRKAYAFEELVAEIGNCMTCARLGLVPDFGQSAAYVENWLRALRDDKRMIFKAATEAQKAADWIMERGEGIPSDNRKAA